MTPHVRPLEPTDHEALVDIIRASFPNLPHGSADDFRESLAAWDRRGLAYRYSVAEVEGTVAGFALVVEIESDEPDLYYLEVAVHPDHRNRGLGARLFQELESAGDAFSYRRTVAWI